MCSPAAVINFEMTTRLETKSFPKGLFRDVCLKEGGRALTFRSFLEENVEREQGRFQHGRIQATSENSLVQSLKYTRPASRIQGLAER